MTIQYLDANFVPNPSKPDWFRPHEIAVEAGVSQDMALSFIEAAWEQAETFTGRAYRGIASGEIVVRVEFPTEYRWPRYPYPATIAADIWEDRQRGWRPIEIASRAGYVELYAGNLYRLVQTPTPAVDPMPAHVLAAVRNLAVYQLVHLPQRREFRTTSFADTTMTREAVMGALYGSGAGALLASEVRK